MAENRVMEATIELKNALQANPGNAEARYFLGEISMQIGDLASAEKEFQRALELGWSADAAVIGKMRALIAQGKYREVLEIDYEIENWPAAGKASFLALRAIAYHGEDDISSARSTFLQAEALDDDGYDVLKARVLLLLAEKNVNGAESALSKAEVLFPNDPELMLMRANLAVSNREFTKAMDVFERIAGRGPENFLTLSEKRAHLGILKLAIMEKDYERMRKSRDALAASNINDLEVYYYLALAAFEERNFDLAEEHLQEILAVSGGHGPTLLLAGSVSFAKRDFEQAAYFLSKYIANYPENTNAQKLLGRAYLALGQYEDAQAAFNVVLEGHPDDAELIALIGLSEISTGQLQSGIAGLEKALALVPESSPLKLQLAKAYIANGETERAVKLLDEMLRNDGADDQIAAIKVLAYLQGQDLKMAIATARQMLARSPDHADVLSLMGSVQLAARDTAAARKYFTRALKLDSGHVNAALNLARLDEQQGALASAERRYMSILVKEPQNVAVMTSLARLAAQQGDARGQVKWLEAARQADRKELLSRVALVEIYLKQGNTSDAEALLRELEEMHTDSLAVLAVKGKLLIAQKRFTQAETIIAEITGARPDLDIGYFLQAQNQSASGNKKAALKNARKAYSLKPDTLRNIVLLARIELAAGNHDRAAGLGAEAIGAAPDSALGYALRGDAKLAMKKYREALADFEKAWKIEQSRDIALRRFRAIQLLSGLAEAAPVLVRWLEQQPDDVPVLLKLATAYLVDKQHKKAATYFEIVLDLEPDNVIALNNLAWLYGLENQPRALELAKKAYTLEPRSPGVIDTYGWILLKNDRIAEASTMLRQAAEMLPDVPEVQYHYAKVLFETGDTGAARSILKPLIESGKAFEGRADAQKMLAR